jgi:hypothetical protein
MAPVAGGACAAIPFRRSRCLSSASGVSFRSLTSGRLGRDGPTRRMVSGAGQRTPGKRRAIPTFNRHPIASVRLPHALGNWPTAARLTRYAGHRRSHRESPRDSGIHRSCRPPPFAAHRRCRRRIDSDSSEYSVQGSSRFQGPAGAGNASVPADRPFGDGRAPSGFATARRKADATALALAAAIATATATAARRGAGPATRLLCAVGFRFVPDSWGSASGENHRRRSNGFLPALDSSGHAPPHSGDGSDHL